MTQKEATEITNKIKTLKSRRCGKCGGWMYLEDTEVVCANCGYTVYVDLIPMELVNGGKLK